MVRHMSSRDARAHFADLIGSVHYSKEPVIVEKNGKPVAVVISPDAFNAYKRFADQAERDWAIIDELRARNAHFDPDEVYRDVTEVVEEVRQERYERAQRAAQSRD